MGLEINDHSFYVKHDLPLHMLQAMAKATELGINSTIKPTDVPGGIKIWFEYRNSEVYIDIVLFLNPTEPDKCSTKCDIEDLYYELEHVEKYRAIEAQKEATRKLIRAKLTEDELAMITFKE